jgi:ferredoxin-NADP reductase
MAILRKHRTAGQSIASPFVLPSFLFAVAPWLWHSPVGLASGFVAHLTWLIVCEWLAPPVVRSRPKPASRAATPAVASKRQPVRGPSFVPAAVLAVLDETPEIKTFRVLRPEGFEFVPGQFVAVKLLTDGKPHVRCYSISSPPHARGYLDISVRNQGLVSGMLHATVKAGSVLSINQPAGQFVYPAGDDRPLALIAGGIGITPLLSMVRHAASCDPTRQVTLFYSARREADLAFRSELRVLAERHPHVRIVLTLTRPTDATRLRTGRVDADLVSQFVSAPAHTIFCLCGPGPMIEDTRQVLAQLGVPAAQVRYEQFDLAVAASQVNTAVAEPAVSPNGGDAVSVTFETSGVTTSALSSLTLLEVAEEAGVTMSSSCRSGVCQSCRTRLKSGDADCRSDVLDPEDRTAGFILPCVTWATGDCVLEA